MMIHHLRKKHTHFQARKSEILMLSLYSLWQGSGFLSKEVQDFAESPGLQDLKFKSFKSFKAIRFNRFGALLV